MPPRGRDDAGKEFERGRLAGPVWAEKGDELALFDLKINATDRFDECGIGGETAR